MIWRMSEMYQYTFECQGCVPKCVLIKKTFGKLKPEYEHHSFPNICPTEGILKLNLPQDWVLIKEEDIEDE
jgi:hypothetical protein